jgi:hypothetical protein
MLSFPHAIYTAVCDLPEEEEPKKKALVLPVPIVTHSACQKSMAMPVSVLRDRYERKHVF